MPRLRRSMKRLSKKSRPPSAISTKGQVNLACNRGYYLGWTVALNKMSIPMDSPLLDIDQLQVLFPPAPQAMSKAERKEEDREAEEGGGGGGESVAAAMDPDAVAKAFVEHYYSTFDANRAGLANLYQESSMLTFEGQKIQGSQNIVAKLTSLPFQQCQHSITTVDCQPSGPAGGMLVFVSGNLQLAGEQHALKFSQMFHLMPTPQGSFYVLNDIFRLNYA
ncbi:hypothetical protein TEA_005919 [Camellia sinensis var. sinensis]|uniref:NTF2 domain-containing protein n=2 Tax=Camellia sinensis TaxID=4442 RepID=A0A4S4E6M5_CAMSN|nr:hypothetical protein TEA_005919 [Camellia sinensis var. sinensis]